MELREFVSETLKQVIDGVKLAQDHAQKQGAKINPQNAYLTSRGDYLVARENKSPVVQQIEFDVAVTTAEGAQAKGGLGIFVAGVGMGTQGQIESKDSTVSRVKFSVLVVLPRQE